MDPQQSPVEQLVSKAVKVFVSYSRESSEHEKRVLLLCDRLSREGVDCVLDQYVQAPPQGWTKWMIESTAACDFIMVICTEAYEKRSQGLGPRGEGRGVKFETFLAYQDLLDGDSTSSKLIPIVFQQSDIGFIPRPLRAFQNYRLDSETGYDDLYRRLTRQPRIMQPKSEGIRQLIIGENLNQVSLAGNLKKVESGSGECRLSREPARRQGIINEEKQTVELNIARDFDEYSVSEQDALLRAIRELLHLGGDLKVKGIRRGSVILSLELPTLKVRALIIAIESGELSDFGVISSSIVQAPTQAKIEAYASSGGPTRFSNAYDTNNDKYYAVGSGIGVAAGATTGTAVSTAVGDPITAVGATAGGLVGHGIAEGVNPTMEDAYWRDNYRNRPYVSADRTYDDYQPAYRYGWESRAQAGNKAWEAAEPELGRNWNDYNRGAARQTWDEAKHATKDAWHRVERALPGDADGDGR